MYVLLYTHSLFMMIQVTFTQEERAKEQIQHKTLLAHHCAVRDKLKAALLDTVNTLTWEKTALETDNGALRDQLAAVQAQANGVPDSDGEEQRGILQDNVTDQGADARQEQELEALRGQVDAVEGLFQTQIAEMEATAAERKRARVWVRARQARLTRDRVLRRPLQGWFSLTRVRQQRLQLRRKVRTRARMRSLALAVDAWSACVGDAQEEREQEARERERDAVKTQSSNAVLLLQGAVSRLTEAKGKMEQERRRAQADAEAQHVRHRACVSRIEQLEQALLNAGVTLPVLECGWLTSCVCVCVCACVFVCVCVCVLVYCENVKVSSLFVRIPSMDRADTKTRAGLCTSTQQANLAHHQLLLTLTRVDLSACTQLRDLDVTQCHQLLDANLRTAATHFTRLQVCVCVCVCVNARALPQRTLPECTHTHT